MKNVNEKKQEVKKDIFTNELVSSANTFVTFTGLGIISFNNEKQHGEIAAIRDGKHRLDINIWQSYGFGTEPQYIYLPVDYGDAPYKHCIPHERAKVEIFTEGESTIQGYEIYQTETDFNRIEEDHDLNDFRWILDMEKTHNDTFGQNLVESSAQGGCDKTKICIKNGLFLTDNSKRFKRFRKIKKKNEITIGEPENFGLLPDTLGVAIDAEQVIIRISIDGESVFEHGLISISPFPSIIQITNNAPGSSSDMKEYYNFFKGSYGDWFDFLLGPQFMSKKINPRNDSSRIPSGQNDIRDVPTQLGFCHPVKAGGDD